MMEERPFVPKMEPVVFELKSLGLINKVLSSGQQVSGLMHTTKNVEVEQEIVHDNTGMHKGLIVKVAQQEIRHLRDQTFTPFDRPLWPTR